MLQGDTLPGLVVERDVALQAFNTLALPSKAKALVRCYSAADVSEARAYAKAKRWALAIVGGGSNILLPEALDALLLKIEIGGRSFVAEDSQAYYVRAGAGENWHDFVQWTLAEGWPGLENLSLIPGTVGAAPIQNIGAYGVEVGAFIACVSGVDLDTGESFKLDAKACEFGYRDSLFKRQHCPRLVITSVEFCLPKNHRLDASYPALKAYLAAQGQAGAHTEGGTEGSTEDRSEDSSQGSSEDQAQNTNTADVTALSAQALADAVCAVRRSKLPQPEELPNVGSFFKNPVLRLAQFEALKARWPDVPSYPAGPGFRKVAAGWLIEKAGWKQRFVQGAEGVCMHSQQALVLTNIKAEPLSAVLFYAEQLQADIKRRFDIELEREPQILSVTRRHIP
ncbi:UDP-N-acetylmuramate dehydrogenase [Agaribacterium haliotis]|uniref:UDP-N-acetylmuramate dehydrogenase n=1 Tax=Agaribacterium haliotis TaxID=2013869 RepID=UPI000BB53ED3|nr:UDP-N-acetylmuramate dehydrogenase [Agaribacterium haliotis]